MLVGLGQDATETASGFSLPSFSLPSFSLPALTVQQWLMIAGGALLMLWIFGPTPKRAELAEAREGYREARRALKDAYGEQRAAIRKKHSFGSKAKRLKRRLRAF